MKLQFISNSGCILYLKNGKRILIDPWITEGIYLGSWIHEPALKYSYEEINLTKDDYIYISHVHEDHLDIDFLGGINKDVSILTPNTPFNFTKKSLSRLGFKKFIDLPIKKNKEIIPKFLSVIAYDQFTKHPFLDEPGVGNIIDTSCLFFDEHSSFFHINDNKLNPKAVLSNNLDKKKIDTILVNYNPAGPYPACFEVPSLKNKIKIARENGIKCLKNTTDVIKLINHKSVIPVSGNYKITDELNEKYNLNKFLGHIDINEALNYMDNNDCKPLQLYEGDLLDIETQKISKKKLLKKLKTVNSKRKSVPYLKKEYPDSKIIKDDFYNALNKMKEREKKYGFSVKTQISIILNHSKSKFVINNGDSKFCKLTLKMDDRLFQMLLNREEFFDNAQIGCHIKFIREPNIYEYDAMTLLQFLHK